MPISNQMSGSARLLNALRIAALLVLLVLRAEGVSFAKDPVFESPPPGFRIGMEIELQPEPFSNLVDYFDFEKLQAERGEKLNAILPAEFYDDYLSSHPQALSEFPDAIRKQLTEGLQLEGSVIRKSSPSDGKLLGADGNAISTHTHIILPGSAPMAPQRLLIHPAPVNAGDALSAQSGGRIILAGAPEPKTESVISSHAVQKQGELVVPKTIAWQKLYERWRALDSKTKSDLVKWESLSPLKKASLAIEYANAQIATKSDLSPEQKRLFDRFSWMRDMGAIEFVHREDLHVSSPADFYRDVSELSKKAGIDRRILDPESSRIRSGGLHFHVSVQDKDLFRLGVPFNKLALVRRISVGILNDLTDSEPFLYEPTAMSKGLVRVVGRDRLEFRVHNMPLADEINFVTKVVGMDTVQAVRFIGYAIRDLMSDYVVDKIAEYRATYLADFLEYMSPAQKKRVMPALARLLYVKQAIHSLPHDFWQQAPELLTSKDLGIVHEVSGVIKDQRVWPQDFVDRFPAMMEHSNALTRGAVANLLRTQEAWANEVWKKVPALMKDPDRNVRIGIVDALYTQKKWTPDVWKQVTALLANPDISVSSAMTNALKSQQEWPKEVWQQISSLLKSKDVGVLHSTMGALEAPTHWPSDVEKLVTDLNASPKAIVRSAARNALSRRENRASAACVLRELSNSI